MSLCLQPHQQKAIAPIDALSRFWYSAGDEGAPMNARNILSPEAILMLALENQPLRRIAELTGIGKNRIQRLRSYPAKARLDELHRFADAGIIRFSINARNVTVRPPRGWETRSPAI